MKALVNADTEDYQRSGLTPTAIPDGQKVKKGVSVEYVPTQDDSKKWYVFRASYGREDKAAELLNTLNELVYVPRHSIPVKTPKGIKHTVKNLLPSFVFAYLKEHEAQLYVKGPAADDKSFNLRPQEEKQSIFKLMSLLSYYYDHFQVGEDFRNPPLTIPFAEMRNFIIATLPQKDVISLQDEKYTFKTDDEVRVVSGQFEGLRGRVIRVKGQTRLLIRLSNFGAFGSAHIPAYLCEKISD